MQISRKDGAEKYDDVLSMMLLARDTDGGGAMTEWEWNLLEDKPSLESIGSGGGEIRIGDRVRLRPRKGGDIMDSALAGKRSGLPV